MAASPRTIGNYRLYEKIGSGGMGTVHLGRLFASGGFRRIVAIKRLHPHLAEDMDFVTAFLDEARLASRIHHPNVVAPLDVVSADGEVFLVFEHVLGLPLSLLLRRAEDAGEGMPLRIAAGVMSQIRTACTPPTKRRGTTASPRPGPPRSLAAERPGRRGRHGAPPRFGIAKASGRAQITAEGVVKGKRGYMAPEHLLGNATRASDLYSAGVVLWEMIARRPLFPEEASVRGRLAGEAIEAPSIGRDAREPAESEASAAALDAIALRALSPHPADRYGTAREMAIALEAQGVATAREVGEWVSRIAPDDLRGRAESVARVEASIDPPVPPSPPSPVLALASVGAAEDAPPTTGDEALDPAIARTGWRSRTATVGGGAVLLLGAALLVLIFANRTPPAATVAPESPRADAPAAAASSAETPRTTAPVDPGAGPGATATESASAATATEDAPPRARDPPRAYPQEGLDEVQAVRARQGRPQTVQRGVPPLSRSVSPSSPSRLARLVAPMARGRRRTSAWRRRTKGSASATAGSSARPRRLPHVQRPRVPLGGARELRAVARGDRAAPPHHRRRRARRRGQRSHEVGVSIDGRELATRLDGRSIAVDPGPHELVFQAHGFAPVRQFIVAREGEKVRHVVALFGASPPATREPPRRRDPAPLVIAGAAGALGLSGFAVFGLWGSRDRDQLAETCAPTQTCRSADVRAARTKLIVADASLLVGIAGAGVFTALMLIPLFEKPRTSPVSVSIAPSPRGVFSAVEYRY